MIAEKTSGVEKVNSLLANMVLIGGPPRSGTTFAAKSLNVHPYVMTLIDDHVYECWALYNYRDRSGLVQELSSRPLTADQVKSRLRHHLFDGDHLAGAAPSAKTIGCPEMAPRAAPASGKMRSLADAGLVRYLFPLAKFSQEWRLCLKSPEISYVLPQLAALLPGVRFLLAYRPAVEIAESMYRLGNQVKRFPVFHARWQQERGEAGEWRLPPGIPAEWGALWQEATGFQRCVINTAAYLRALVDGVAMLSQERFFVYNHARLREQPEETFNQIARFLAVEASGFHSALPHVHGRPPAIPPELEKEMAAIEKELHLSRMEQMLEAETR